MKKVFLRSLAVFMVACMFVLTGGGFTVAKDEIFVEIVVEGDIAREKAQLIIATLNGEEIISPRSILCLIGHSMAQTTAIYTEHRVWPNAPRCRRTTYRVDYCTRSSCNYIVYTQTSVMAVHCC
jgi:hypothetical protein